MAAAAVAVTATVTSGRVRAVAEPANEWWEGGTKVIRIWYERSTKVVRKRWASGTKVVRKWQDCCRKVVREWYEHDLKVGVGERRYLQE